MIHTAISIFHDYHCPILRNSFPPVRYAPVQSDWVPQKDWVLSQTGTQSDWVTSHDWNWCTPTSRIFETRIFLSSNFKKWENTGFTDEVILYTYLWQKCWTTLGLLKRIYVFWSKGDPVGTGYQSDRLPSRIGYLVRLDDRSDWMTGPTGYPVRLGDLSDWYPVTQSGTGTGASLVPTVKYDGGNVKCWGCFSSCDVGNLVFIDGNMTGEVYRDILQKTLFESIKKLNLGREWLMQKDNDPKHRAHIVAHWLKEKEVELLKWPPFSPDLNPIEHMWDEMERRMKKEEPKNETELKQSLLRVWYGIGTDVTKKLVNSVPNRVNEVIRINGYPTRYWYVEKVSFL